MKGERKPQNTAKPTSLTLQYVILPPQASLPSRDKAANTARDTALEILRYSGDNAQDRTFRNTLLFIAARRDAIRDLKNLVKNYLAWNSIMTGDDLHGALSDLTGERRDQTTGNLESAEDAVTTALFKAYRWDLHLPKRIYCTLLLSSAV
ncbi:hypothetical protein F4009_10410 [Candidatus Poribacteria bacterium]|nr:hypothetical protein [Candidatus Poribacteria bacterium]MYH81847.1 hypothetical protein [Candidatus Poribacteria bacterium]MYK94384.1 hypothetical protein [Candidatus Poribacteria bacterium]